MAFGVDKGLSAGERVRLHRPGEPNRRQTSCCVQDNKPVMAEFNERFEFAAADPEVGNFHRAACVAVPISIGEVDTVARNDERARVHSGLELRIQVPGVEASLPVTGIDRHVRSLRLNNEDGKRHFPHRKIGEITACALRVLVERRRREVFFAFDRGRRNREKARACEQRPQDLLLNVRLGRVRSNGQNLCQYALPMNGWWRLVPISRESAADPCSAA